MQPILLHPPSEPPKSGARLSLPESGGLRYRMREHQCGRYAAVSREGIDYTLQFLWFCKRTADHKTVITGDTDHVQDLWHGFEQRNVPLNVLMRGAHPYDGLKP